MNSLEYTIFGNKKKILIENINKNKNLVQHSGNEYEYKVTEQSQRTFNKLLNLLDLWNKFSKKHNITYWATAGTLLGAVRHNGFIPWDNDIDICVYLSDLTKIKEKLNEHSTFKYKECAIGLRLYIDNVFPFLDVFVCDYYDNDTIKYSGFILDNKSTWFINDTFPKEYFFKEELNSLEEIPFENITIMAPKQANKILCRMFSKKCLTECIITSSTELHETNETIMKSLEVGEEIIKQIYTVENKLKIPNNRTVTYFVYKTYGEIASNDKICDFLKKIQDISMLK